MDGVLPVSFPGRLPSPLPAPRPAGLFWTNKRTPASGQARRSGGTREGRHVARGAGRGRRGRAGPGRPAAGGLPRARDADGLGGGRGARPVATVHPDSSAVTYAGTNLRHPPWVRHGSTPVQSRSQRGRYWEWSRFVERSPRGALSHLKTKSDTHFSDCPSPPVAGDVSVHRGNGRTRETEREILSVPN